MSTALHKAFLSHQSRDKPTVEIIGSALLESGIDVFYDAWDIQGGESIPGAIEAALTTSDIFIYALSPSSIESKWVEAEYHGYLFRKINDHSLRMIPILIEGCEKPALIAPIKHIDFRSFDASDPSTQQVPIETLLRTILRNPTKPPIGVPHPSLASYEFYFQKMKRPPDSSGAHWEVGFKNLTDHPLHNFEFAIEFESAVESVEYDFGRSSANMAGGEYLSNDKKMYHWFGNQIMENDGWVVFVIKTSRDPVIRRLCTRLLGRTVESHQLIVPDPDGVSSIAAAIRNS